MYELYYYPGNASAAPHMVLEALGVPFELRLVDRALEAQKSTEYLAINPNGRIPTLVDNGKPIFESAAIVLHLVDADPRNLLAPAVGTPARGQFYQWLIFLTNSLQEALMNWQYPSKLSGGQAAAESIIKMGAEKQARDFLSVIDRHLVTHGPFFLGEMMSAADLYLTMLCRWARPMPNGPRSHPAIARLLDQTTGLPAVQRAYTSAGIVDDIA